MVTRWALAQASAVQCSLAERSWIWPFFLRALNSAGVECGRQLPQWIAAVFPLIAARSTLSRKQLCDKMFRKRRLKLTANKFCEFKIICLVTSLHASLLQNFSCFRFWVGSESGRSVRAFRVVARVLQAKVRSSSSVLRYCGAVIVKLTAAKAFGDWRWELVTPVNNVQRRRN